MILRVIGVSFSLTELQAIMLSIHDKSLRVDDKNECWFVDGDGEEAQSVRVRFCFLT